MRHRNAFNKMRALPRMSWSLDNLYNLWCRQLGPLANETNFTKSSMTLFQQRWKSKRLVRGYHADWIGEKKFKRWYLPERLPDVRERQHRSSSAAMEGLAKWTQRDEPTTSNRELEAKKAASAPVGSLMFMEVERRIDVFLFRSCFATSAYQARQLVVHGKVTLNGEKHSNPNTRLNPGDLVSVDPNAMPLIQEGTKQIPTTIESRPELEAESQTTTTTSDSSAEPSSETKLDAASEEAIASAATAAAEAAKEAKEVARKAAWAERKAPAFSLPPYASPHLFIPAYIETSFATCSAVYVRHPTARPGYSEIPTPYDADGEVMRFAWEWYAKNRPRMREGTRRRWMSPEDA